MESEDGAQRVERSGGMKEKGKKTVNLPRVRAALGRIERVLTEHPDLRERTVKFFSGELPGGLEDEMPRGRAGMRALTIRLPEDLLAKAEEMAPRLQAQREEKNPDARITGRSATAADVVRVALQRGIMALDVELPPAGRGGKSKAKPKAGSRRGKR